MTDLSPTVARLLPLLRNQGGTLEQMLAEDAPVRERYRTERLAKGAPT